MLSPYTYFHREDCHTIEQVRRLGREMNMRSTNWRRIGVHMAQRLGKFIVWRCDDTIVVFETGSDDKIHRRSHKPNTWRFS